MTDRLVLPAQVFLTLGQERRRHQQGQPIRAGVPIRLAIDTGSGRSSLIPSTLDPLKALARERVHVTTSQGTGPTRWYWVRLEFPDTDLRPIPLLAVASLNLPPNMTGFHGVLGHDVLIQEPGDGVRWRRGGWWDGRLRLPAKPDRSTAFVYETLSPFTEPDQSPDSALRTAREKSISLFRHSLDLRLIIAMGRQAIASDRRGE